MKGCLTMKKVSIIVPVYNTEKYLVKCLDSLVNQTLEEIEVIAVNDGSTDGSQNILDMYAEKYPEKIRCIYQENAGQSAARNNGLKLATGEYIYFVDSDDFIDPETCELLYSHAKEKDLDILGFSLKEIRGNTVIKASSIFAEIDTKKRMMIEQTMVCNKLFNRRFLLEIDAQFEEGLYYEDLEFSSRVASIAKKTDWIDAYLYNYVTRENSTMHQTKFNNRLNDIYIILDKLKESIGQNYGEELEYLYIEHLLFSAAGRFIWFDEGKQQIKKISEIMKKQFPNWKKNCYYKSRNIKYKIFCMAAYYRCIQVLKILTRIRNMI